MDDPAFDRVTRLFWAPGSRRAALRAVLGAALVGSTRQTAAAAPQRPRQGRGPEICAGAPCAPPPHDATLGGFCCSGQHCSCAGECCNNRCFWFVPSPEFFGEPAQITEFCCRGPDLIVCENARGEDTCCRNEGKNPCRFCLVAGGIAGSYRRRR